jgi:hypothetical protein
MKKFLGKDYRLFDKNPEKYLRVFINNYLDIADMGSLMPLVAADKVVQQQPSPPTAAAASAGASPSPSCLAVRIQIAATTRATAGPVVMPNKDGGCPTALKFHKPEWFISIQSVSELDINGPVVQRLWLIEDCAPSLWRWLGLNNNDVHLLHQERRVSLSDSLRNIPW